MENNQNLPTEEVKVENKQSNNTKPDTKLYNILSYIGILWLVGLLTPSIKEEKDVKFHVGQGMMLTIVSTVASIILSTISGIVGFIFGLVGAELLATIVSIILSIVSLAVSALSLILMILGIINANNGKEEPLPVIGKYAFYK